MSLIYSDLKNRLIYHWQILVVLLLSCVGSFIYGYSLNFVASLVAVIIGFCLWKLNIIGGGDVKLISVLMICFSYTEISLFLVLMMSIGWIIAIFTLVFRSKRGVPYAPAIIMGHLVVFYDTYIRVI